MQILFVDYTQVGLFALTLCSDLDTQLITSEPLPGIRIVSLKLKQLCAVVKHEEVSLGEGRPFERHLSALCEAQRRVTARLTTRTKLCRSSPLT